MKVKRMIERVVRIASTILCVGLGLSCAGHTGEEALGQQSAALETSGLTPWPCAQDQDTGEWKISWNGTTTQLLVADAWGGCVGELAEDWVSASGAASADPYLADIKDKMIAAFGDRPPFGFIWAWTNERAHSVAALPWNGNCDPQTGTPAERGVFIRNTPSEITLASSVSDHPGRAAQFDLWQATVNLCIAQRLRNVAPGASAGEVLLLPESEQRELLETIRERAQIAMLQYALLGVTFTNNSTTYPTATEAGRLPVLFAWANTNTDERIDQLKKMGSDFAGAVQLHSMVSGELVELYARTRSARAKQVSTPASPAAELWGKGSWYQRMLAVAYGGDPLFESDSALTAPIHTRDDAMVGIANDPSWTNERDWPDRDKRPFFETAIQQPQVQLLLGLARRFDRLELVQSDSTTSCDPFDIERSAQRLYKYVEAEVRRADCVREQPISGPCPTTLELPTTAPGMGTWRLHEKYRVEMEHARSLASYLADAVGGRINLNNAGCKVIQNYSQYGAADLAGDVLAEAVDGADHPVHISAGARFPTPGLNEIAGPFVQRAAIRFPTPGDVRDLGHVAVDGLGFARTVFGGGVPDYANTEAKRTMGAVAAQAAVRKMVRDSLMYLRSGTGAIARLQDFFAFGDSVLGLTGAQVGTGTLSIRPRIISTEAISGWDASVEQQNTGPVFDRTYKWIVEVEVPANDAFWQQASGKVTELYAVRGPRAHALAAHPKTTILGDSIGSLVQAAPKATGTIGALPGTPERQVWSATIALPVADYGAHYVSETYPIPSAEGFTFVAGRRSSSDSVGSASEEYRLLAANVRIYGPAARDGLTLAFGGSLGRQVERQTLGRTENPVEPAYDGFDLPTGWVPPFTAELLGGSAAETSVDKYLTLADQAATDATLAVQAALDSVTSQINSDVAQTREEAQLNDKKAEQAAKLAFAAGEARAAMKEEQDRLCGAAGADCVQGLFLTDGIRFYEPEGSEPTCTEGDSAAGAKCAIDKLAYRERQRVDTVVRNIRMPSLVAELFGSPSATFDQYNGGSLQGAMIDLHRALRAPADQLDLLDTAAGKARDSVDEAQAVIDHAQSQTATIESQQRFLKKEEAAQCDPYLLARTLSY